MAFEPARMVAPDGRDCLVGSATEREQLITQGYKIAEPEPKPVARPAVERPAPADKKPTTAK
ncbi:hypothetical protein ACFRAQ_35735 [Nocardia sp. NPDC056611]|uniref:hypothetical protein n=1 Tax=Nocardia sp. NPDC056611 TaxID=3345877 RepID=UPI00367349D1